MAIDATHCGLLRVELYDSSSPGAAAYSVSMYQHTSDGAVCSRAAFWALHTPTSARRLHCEKSTYAPDSPEASRTSRYDTLSQNRNDETGGGSMLGAHSTLLSRCRTSVPKRGWPPCASAAGDGGSRCEGMQVNLGEGCLGESGGRSTARAWV